MVDFTPVEEALETAKGIGFDGCHKIYVLMDDEQMRQMREYGYDPLISATDSTPSQMLQTVMEWYDQSCGLRFVESVKTKDDEDDEFVALIPQGADEEEEECDECYYKLSQCVCDEDDEEEDY